MIFVLKILQGKSTVSIIFYRRSIDNLFFLRLGSRKELEKSIIYVNSIFPSTKLTAEYSYETRSVNYLDIRYLLMNTDQGYIRTDLYKKENKKNIFFLPAVILTI